MRLTYEQAVAQLLSLADFERKTRSQEAPGFHIQRTALLLEALGNPHRSVPAIHVAGSKGKGSTCAMIAAALTASGLRTGMFSSPHLHKITERIAVDGEPISRDQFVSLFERLWPIAENIRQKSDAGMVSVFEFQTAMAFLHFADVGADAMVIEVGLGGRLDSTNVITPVVSVITPIGMDHVAVLGDTISAIAGEKAGIIKPGVPVVSSRQVPDAARVISDTAMRRGSNLTHSSSVKVVSSAPNGAGPQLVKFQSPTASYEIELPLLGEHQVQNAATAIAALEVFSGSTLPITSSTIANGLAKTHWPARVQVLETTPNLLIADGAHNADSAVALRAAIQRHFGNHGRFVLVLGATGGHDPLAVARAFADLSQDIVVTRSRHPKAVEPADFAAALVQDRITVTASTVTTTDGIAKARMIAKPDSVIIATGSLFVAAEAIESILSIEPETYPDLRGTAGPLRLKPHRAVSAPSR
ncbi:MAG: bifunctional folylpolyglutamate synthase/dihydrofolate synthase [Chloroflexi bacterium]|nr:bifunctional folylpolyglutamate synthase/dihydrofolate synthase [Chloroflexota bacterium]